MMRQTRGKIAQGDATFRVLMRRGWIHIVRPLSMANDNAGRWKVEWELTQAGYLILDKFDKG
jgi:hypothetical protein